MAVITMELYPSSIGFRQPLWLRISGGQQGHIPGVHLAFQGQHYPVCPTRLWRDNSNWWKKLENLEAS